MPNLLLVLRETLLYNTCMSSDVTYEIDRETLTAAIIELNSMSPCDGVIMNRDGKIRVGNLSDDDFFCMLIPAGKLARQLTADGLASYAGKELKAWADKYDIGPLEQLIQQALS